MAADSPWTQYRGPHGGQGWRNATTGEVLYQKDRPGTREAAQPGAGAGKSLAGQPGAKPAAPSAESAKQTQGEATKPGQQSDKQGVGYGTKDGWPWAKAAPTAEEMTKAFPPANPHGDDTQLRYRTQDGTYTPERQQLHQQIVGSIFKGKQPVPAGTQPVCMFLGGGTAAGKSTAIRSGGIRVPDGAVHVDADEVKNELPEFRRMAEDRHVGAAGVVHEESSDLSKAVVAKATKERYHAVIDGTGDTSLESITKKVKQARSAGHRIVAHYCTNDIEKAMSNAQKRASKPPYRLVDAEVTVGIHANVSRVFPQAVEAGLFDEFSLWDTNGDKPVLVCSGKGKDMQVHDQAAWKKFLDKQNLMETHKHLYAGTKQPKTKATVKDVYMALAGDEPGLDIPSMCRIAKEVAIGREPKTPDDPAAAEFRERAQGRCDAMKTAGQVCDIPSDWPDVDETDSSAT